MQCPLCREQKTEFYHERASDGFHFFNCIVCGFVFLDPARRLSIAEEKTRYELHENMDSFGHREFLGKLLTVLEPHLSKSMNGLDYGSGPVQVMEGLFQKRGYSMVSYDPIFLSRPLAIESFDFITCSEVVEHFYSPREEIEKIFSLLKPGGFLGVMTSFLPEKEKFSSWHYQRDSTHVGFYSPKSLAWIEKKFARTMKLHGSSIAIFCK